MVVIQLDDEHSIPTHMLGPIALTIHRIIGRMPVAVKCRGQPGVLVNDDAIVDGRYEGHALERALASPGLTKVRLADGAHPGKEMYVSPINSRGDGEASCAIGVIDTSGTLALKEFAEAYTTLWSQVGGHSPAK